MSDEEIILTRAGYEQLKQELESLLHDDYPVMSSRMEDAHDDNEFSDDSTFFDIMSAKNRLDERIAHLRMILARATVIEDDQDPATVSPGDRVTVLDMDYKEEIALDMLGSQEVAHGRHGVSIASPVGKALLGQKVGTKVEVKVPDGLARYKILKIAKIPN